MLNMTQPIPLLALLSAASGAAPAAATVPDSVADRIDAYLSRLEPLGFSGAVVVTHDGEVLIERGYGWAQREASVPMGPRTLLPLGSISKHFTAAAILSLVMHEQITVDLTLGDLFEDVPAEKSAITIHQLLTHSSGLPSSSGFGGAATSLDEFLARAFSSDLVFPPGTGQSYSNVGYGVLAAIVEHVTGTPYEEYLRTAILAPAGMEKTGVRSAEWNERDLAHGYVDDQNQGPLGAGWDDPPWGLLGAGGMQATTGDMARWDRAMATASVLDRETLELMTTPHLSRGGFGSGYGCGIEPTPWGTAVGHDGSNDVFGADWRRYVDEGVMIFVATNDANVYAMDVAPRIAEIVFGGEVPAPPAVVDLGTDVVEAYAGRYSAGSDGSVVVQASRGGLVLSSADIVPAKFLHPVPAAQTARRDRLLETVPAAFEAAYRGEFEALHELLDPFVPFEEFVESRGANMQEFEESYGAFQQAGAASGRNRFGEIALVVTLSFERGDAMIEYSFGPREVGSIRWLEEFPRRIVQPTSPSVFVDYDIEEATTWSVRFELGSDGSPVALLLSADGTELRAERER